MKSYELIPTDGRKSFYGKAVVKIAADGSETLYSYNTPIIKRTASGELVKLWGRLVCYYRAAYKSVLRIE